MSWHIVVSLLSTMPEQKGPTTKAAAPPAHDTEMALLQAQVHVLRSQLATEATQHSGQIVCGKEALADLEAVLSHSRRLEAEQKTMIAALQVCSAYCVCVPHETSNTRSTQKAKLAEVTATLSARDAEVARLLAEAVLAKAKTLERDRLVQERALLDGVARSQAELMSRQTAELAQLTAHCTALERQAATSREEVDALRLQTRSTTALQTLFGRPCLVSRQFHKLVGTPPSHVEHATCCAMGESWVILHCWAQVPLAAGDPAFTYALHVPTHTWHKLPMHGSAARGRVALTSINTCAPSCDAAAAMLFIGGSACHAANTDDARILSDASVLLLSNSADSSDGLEHALGPAQLPHWGPPTAAHPHLARVCASACSSTTDGTLFVVAGCGASGAAFDCSVVAECAASTPHNLVWRCCEQTHHSQLAPSPRTNACIAASPDGARVWLFGGVDDAHSAEGRRLRDLFSYDTAARKWTNHEPAAGPGPCGRDSAALCVLNDDTVLLAGGRLDDAGSPVHDLWALHVPSMAWQCVVPAPPSSDEAPEMFGSCGAMACINARGDLLKLHTRTDASGVAVCDVLETVQLTLPDQMDAIIVSAESAARMTEDTDYAASTTLRLWLHAAGSTSLELRWRPPARNAERITGYALMHTPAGSTLSAAACYRGMGEWATVAGLKTNWEYVFCLKCSYDDGSHAWSDTVAFRTRRAADGEPPAAARRPAAR